MFNRQQFIYKRMALCFARDFRPFAITGNECILFFNPSENPCPISTGVGYFRIGYEPLCESEVCLILGNSPKLDFSPGFLDNSNADSVQSMIPHTWYLIARKTKNFFLKLRDILVVLYYLCTPRDNNFNIC